MEQKMETTMQKFSLCDDDLADLEALYERVKSSASEMRAAMTE